MMLAPIASSKPRAATLNYWGRRMREEIETFLVELSATLSRRVGKSCSVALREEMNEKRWDVAATFEARQLPFVLRMTSPLVRSLCHSPGAEGGPLDDDDLATFRYAARRLLDEETIFRQRRVWLRKVEAAADKTPDSDWSVLALTISAADCVSAAEVSIHPELEQAIREAGRKRRLAPPSTAVRAAALRWSLEASYRPASLGEIATLLCRTRVELSGLPLAFVLRRGRASIRLVSARAPLAFLVQDETEAKR